MKKIHKISVLGCGWFGFPMANYLISRGFQVKGSTTRKAKLQAITEMDIDAFLVQFTPLLNDKNAVSFFDCDLLLITIPPGNTSIAFLSIIKEVISIVEKLNVKHVLFISSTSVYAERNTTFTENDDPHPETEKGKILLEAENLLRTNPYFTTTVIRFAGLVGPGRHPGKFLAGKTNIANGLSPVNLLHLTDCIGIVYEIIRQEAFGYLFNACTPNHPSRRDFYTLAATSIHLPLPEFVDEKLKWKIIDSVNTPLILGYRFVIDNLIHSLDNKNGVNLY